jgi:hypothetical protein
MFLNARKTERTYLLGAWASKGVIKESGQVYDSTKVRLMCLDRVGGNGQALGFQDEPWGTSENFQKIAHLDPVKLGPLLVDIEYEEEDKNVKADGGKFIKQRVRKILELRPVEVAAAGGKAGTLKAA